MSTREDIVLMGRHGGAVLGTREEPVMQICALRLNWPCSQGFTKSPCSSMSLKYWAAYGALTAAAHGPVLHSQSAPFTELLPQV